MNAPTPDAGYASYGLRGASALVVGAGGVLGSAVATALVAGGAKVSLASGNVTALEQLQVQLPAAFGIPMRADSPRAATAIVEAAVEAHGRLNLLFVASGSSRLQPSVDMTLEEFDHSVDANLRQPWLACQAVGRHLIDHHEPGSIVLTSSTRGKLGHPAGLSAYCASKAAIEGLTRALAAEWGPYGIRVNAVGPSAFPSPLASWLTSEDERSRAVREGILGRTPLGRFAEVGDVVGTVLHLLSDQAAFCTGQVLYIDGGLTSS